MASRNRRRTQWLGAAINEEMTEGDNFIQLLDAGQLTEHAEEPTLIRLFGRLTQGHGFDVADGFGVIRTWGAIYMGDFSGSAIAGFDGNGFGDERILACGFLKSAHQFEGVIRFDSAGLITGNSPALRNQRGPWEMADFESRAMRKVREGDSLILQASSFVDGDISNIGLEGFVRALIKE